MEDTTLEIRELVYQTVMSRTEEERFLMCAEMFETAKELAKISMPVGISPEEQKRFVYQRIHGEDFLIDE